MWDLGVCVACLATDVRMYSMSANSLLQPYQLLAGVQLDKDNDYLPKKLCWECAALVNKFNLFRHKCERAYLLLQDIYNHHDEIMEQFVKEIDREQHRLSSPLGITHIPNYSLNSRSYKVTKDTRREPVVTPPVKHEFEVQIVKAEDDLVKYEPELHLNEPSANSDCNEEVECDWKNLQEPDEEERSLGDQKVTKEGVKESSLQELGWTEVALTKEEVLEMYSQRKNSTQYKKAAYKCELCCQAFQAKCFLVSHMSRHEPSYGAYECSFCKVRFKTQKNIQKHVELQHTKKYTCNMCKANLFSRCTAERHYKKHQKCGLVLKARKIESKEKRKQQPTENKRKARGTKNQNYFGYVEHLQTQEQMMAVVRERQLAKGYDTAPFKCHLCFKIFLRNMTYSKHMTLHDPVSGEFECDICKIRLRSRRKVLEHITRSHLHKYTCNTCPYVNYIRNVVQDHCLTHKGVKFMCHVCAATFSREGKMKEHVLKKHPAFAATSYVCGECGSSFPTDNGLVCHQRQMHQVATLPEENAPYCEECKVQFASRKAWTKHVLNSERHKDLQKDIVNGCVQCGETFHTNASLRRHTSEQHPDNKNVRSAAMFHRKPQPCALCGELMVNAQGRWDHHRRRHPGEPYLRIRPARHACEQCGKHFHAKTLLEQHRMVHSGAPPLQCSVCPKAFYMQTALRHHISITHSEERPFKCDACDMSFKVKAALKRHLYVHTGERPYACNKCEKAFTTREWLRLHVRRVHNKEHIPTKPRVRKRKPPV